MAQQDEDKPKKGEVSILEQGLTGGEGLSDSFKMLFNLAFASIGLGMIQNMLEKAGPAMSNPLAGFTQDGPAALPTGAPKIPSAPKISAFAPRAPTGL